MKKLIIPIILIIVVTGGIILYLQTQTNKGEVKPDNTENPIETNEVTIKDYKYSPSVISIKKGETVTWTNKDSVRHNVSHASFEGPLLSKEESYNHTFDEVGTYDYHCTPHPYMEGTVIVEE